MIECYSSPEKFSIRMRFWEKGLNPEQLRAVLQTEGPVLILAGAGSGKTKTLTNRIAYLIEEKKVSPANILAVTFTNKAAEEMRERTMRLLGQSEAAEHGATVLPQHIGTFHNICCRILRREIEALGYDRRFNILDSQDQESMIKKALKELEINPDQVKPRALLDAISRAKNAFIDAQQFSREAGSYYEEIIAKVYAHYQAALRAQNALDFDDLIMLTVKLFQEHPQVLEKYQDIFRYVMVDEYQDTNYPQYLLVHLLAKKHNNLFVIGDDYQSIYGWRQADIRNILNFEKDYPAAAVITLDRNYRSTQIILDAATGIIGKNLNQRHKKLWTEIQAGELITLVPAEDEEAEARYVAETIAREHANGRPLDHFAVLYRTNAQSRILEEMFLRHSIQYRIVGGLKFYQRKEIKDMVAYARLFENPRDTLALERIANEPARGLGKATLEKWIRFARESELDLFDAGYKLSPETSGLREPKIKTRPRDPLSEGVDHLAHQFLFRLSRRHRHPAGRWPDCAPAPDAGEACSYGRRNCRRGQRPQAGPRLGRSVGRSSSQTRSQHCQNQTVAHFPPDLDQSDEENALSLSHGVFHLTQVRWNSL